MSLCSVIYLCVSASVFVYRRYNKPEIIVFESEMEAIKNNSNKNTSKGFPSVPLSLSGTLLGMVRNSRILKELNQLSLDPPHGIAAWPADENSLENVHVRMTGPEDTPYQEGVFKLEITIGERYPFEPPSIRFITKVYHPNIDNEGRICLDSLKMPPKGAWQPALNMGQLLSQIRLLLAQPNPEDPLMPDVTEIYRNNRELFNQTASNWTSKYAKSDCLNRSKVLNNEAMMIPNSTSFVNGKPRNEILPLKAKIKIGSDGDSDSDDDGDSDAESDSSDSDDHESDCEAQDNPVVKRLRVS